MVRQATGMLVFVMSLAATAFPHDAADTLSSSGDACAAIWQSCKVQGCCMDSCTCNGTAYKQCVPPQGKWQCGSPTPTPTPPAPPTPTPPVPTPGKLDIIGYYGNSGNAVSAIPKFADIHTSYNVLILTFAAVDAAGNFSLIIQGPYQHNMTALAADLGAWNAGK